jgi:hypothetical protein
MRHPTYKHLEAKLRIGAFSVGQWMQITAAGVAAAIFGGYVSPLPTQATIFVSIVGAGLPVALSYGAMGLEFSVAQFVRAGWRYWREPHRFVAGAGEPSGGYVVLAEAAPRDAGGGTRTVREGEALWDV